ncbi:ADP-ribosyltransferase [Candidatus Enterococcus mansonii]|uniref:ADP ribosyltransferase domain-containing protein n=1 Tax=Candidatus Enterococcus mansonii TaxID=1834181 RepID=A0A242CIF3_9ENTE|nr:ADP-ribosyltransferase [Enterococcus sp. 4G2_DIV0659]OTO09908.1 hypothetical protein A5880_000591 [Enterococcus sp. 4G2_DIV0659]
MNKRKYGEIDCDNFDKNVFRSFTTPEESDQWGNEIYGEWSKQYRSAVQSLSSLESGISYSINKDPLAYYCGYYYKKINKYLRNLSLDFGENLDLDEVKSASDILQFLLSFTPRLPENIIVYKIVSDDFINLLIEHNKSNPEEPFSEKGLLSTSLLIEGCTNGQTNDCGLENNLLKIFVPKGIHGIYIRSIEGLKRREYEFLMRPTLFLRPIAFPYWDDKRVNRIYEYELISLDTFDI